MWDDNKTLGMSKKWCLVTPPLAFVENQNMGNKMEKNNWQNIWMGGLAMGECEDRLKSLAILKQIVNIPNKDMENYHWVMFTHAIIFF